MRTREWQAGELGREVLLEADEAGAVLHEQRVEVRQAEEASATKISARVGALEPRVLPPC